MSHESADQNNVHLCTKKRLRAYKAISIFLLSGEHKLSVSFTKVNVFYA